MPTRYLLFLMRLVIDKAPGEYRALLSQLNEIAFFGLVPNDDNRAADGVQLRSEFMEEEGATRPLLFADSECTMLEMLIGLARRLEIEMYGSRWYKTTDAWFWILIQNLGLDLFDDHTYHRRETPNYVNDICDTFLNRRYKRNGEGGLFPLKNPKKDQKTVEIAYQMSDFIMENYPF